MRGLGGLTPKPDFIDMLERLAITILVLLGAASANAQHLVPLVELKAHPADSLETYTEGVSTVGYLHAEPGGGAYLFLTRDHALADDIASALFLVDDTEDLRIYGMSCNNEYVRVEGSLAVDGGQLSLNKIESIRRTNEARSFCFLREESE